MIRASDRRHEPEEAHHDYWRPQDRDRKRSPSASLLGFVLGTHRALGGVRLGFPEAPPQKRQQLVRRSKPQLAARVDFFNPTLESAVQGLRLGRQLEDECPSHHTNRLRRLEGRVVKVPLKIRWSRASLPERVVVAAS
jgi:hypothetical protein